MRTLGLTLGLLVGLTVTAFAQAPKITATGGWCLMVDASVATLAQAQAIVVTVDGTNATGVVWTGTATPFTAQIPLSQLAASYRTVGMHTAVVAFVTSAGAPVILADGSTLTPSPGTPLSHTYEVVAQPTGPSPTNPRWLKIAGTIALAVLGIALAFLGSRG